MDCVLFRIRHKQRIAIDVEADRALQRRTDDKLFAAFFVENDDLAEFGICGVKKFVTANNCNRGSKLNLSDVVPTVPFFASDFAKVNRPVSRVGDVQIASVVRRDAKRFDQAVAWGGLTCEEAGDFLPARWKAADIRRAGNAF